VPSPNVFSSRIMQGLVCPIGAASTWLHRSPAKTGKDLLVGCVPQSPHGCILSTGQATRKFHRTMAGQFNHFLFASDFMEHSCLHARDVNLSPPAFMASIKALIRSKSFLLLSRASKTSITSKDDVRLVGEGSSDVETALLVSEYLVLIDLRVVSTHPFSTTRLLTRAHICRGGPSTSKILLSWP